jgi:RNA-splicing ligase RtcB
MHVTNLNHFIEVGRSKITGDVWITIHCGSRNFGKQICEFHQGKAVAILDNKRNTVLKAEIEKIKNTENKAEIQNKIKQIKIDLGLDFTDINIHGMEYLEGQDAMLYYFDMIFAQKYAAFNRQRIMENIVKILGCEVKESIECVHNYINFSDMIIRKGAISAYEDEKVIIPFNMADGLLICRGKSNPDWNYSAPHGAGRLLSRGEASRKIDLDDFINRMSNVVSTSVGRNTLDESPQAYKNAEMIEAAIEPTVEIIDRIVPMLNLKDGGDGETWKERKAKIKARNMQL